MKNVLIAALAAAAVGASIAQGTVDELVSVYLQGGGKDGDRFPITSKTVVIYPERKCPFAELRGHEKMRAATVSRVPHCSFQDGATVFVIHPTAGVSTYPSVFFAVAEVDQRGVATVVQQGFDSEKAQRAFLQAERERTQRSTPGTLPQRGSAQP